MSILSNMLARAIVKCAHPLYSYTESDSRSYFPKPLHSYPHVELATDKNNEFKVKSPRKRIKATPDYTSDVHEYEKGWLAPVRDISGTGGGRQYWDEKDNPWE